MRFPTALRRPGAVFVVAAALVVSGAAVPASAARLAPVSYVNLGDSYSAGWGALAPTATVNPVMASPGCFIGGRPDDVTMFSSLKSVSLAGDYACAGATVGTTTSGVPTIAQQAAKAGADKALGSATGLVTLTAGGNDVNFGAIILACASDTTPQALQCQAAAAQGITIAQQIDLAGTVGTIRGFAANAKIAWIGYPHLFATADESTTVLAGGGVMSAAAATVFDEGTDALNAILATKAQSAGAQFVDVTSKFEGHEIGSSDSWFNLGPYTDFNFHPNSTGYAEGYYPAMTSGIKPSQL
ncbi:SGNH/GDSL hydrolase family protein [Arthrobacter sp. ISL-72]|uniref:SGNH/GDSL hydrolase family protein n=1 Tax=Arthrobacter sp. ISL-72 TaxID=2819114 RepID=UPI001BEB7C48|nr:SGNH/GDSL hydrolase family protein [Arthrobacter sp. ISL-72]MBT2594075.1 SGNH/GDSL hydrolase family protein [Arthrobacter sp. ISL-72]